MSAAAVGISLHYLILDEFQGDAYYGGVVDHKGRFGHGLMLALRKIY